MRLALAAARATAFASRATGRGGGTTLPGPRADRAGARRAAPAGGAAAARLRARVGHERQDDDVRAARRGAARARVHSPATAPARTSPPASPRRWRCARPPRAELGLFECDEAALPAIAAQLEPSAIALGNLFRDQLDRYGELELVADRWRELVAHLDAATTLVVCADDPLTASIAEGHPAVVRYGIDDPSVALAVAPHAADARFCVRCGHPYDYRAAYVGHLSDYACPNCGNARAPLDLAARAINLRGLDGTAFDLCHGDEPCASSSRCRASTTSRTRSPPPRSRSCWASRWRSIAEGLGALPRRVRPLPAPARGRRRARAAADQEPGRRQRGAAHPPATATRRCSSPSTTASPTGATSRGSGTWTGS